MFWRLTTVADDFGRFESDPRVLLAQCFPLWAGSIKLSQVIGWYNEMTIAGLVTPYCVEGKQLGFFNTWDRHQRIRAKHSKYPPPSSDNICSQVLANVAEKREARSEESRSEDAGVGAPPAGPLGKVPDSIMAALDRCRKLGGTARLRTWDYWQPMIRAYPGVDLPAVILESETYLMTHPNYKDLPDFLRGSIKRAYARIKT